MAETDWVDVETGQATKNFEGRGDKTYPDPKTGELTTMYGINIKANAKYLPRDIVSGLRKRIKPEEAEKAFAPIWDESVKRAENFIGKDVFDKLPQDIKDTLYDMSYNLRTPNRKNPKISRFEGFTKLKKEIRNGNFQNAAEEMKDSAWFNQVGNRSKKHYETMRGVGYGNRTDGTPKGKGFLGELQRPDGKVSTEISVSVNMDGKDVLIPTLVPTLTEQEKNYLLGGGKPNKSIVDKAVEHAKMRMSKGKNVFAENGDIPDDFKSTFANARKQGLKEFDWNGKRYTTEVR